MLPKSQRLSAANVREVLVKGKRFRDSFISVKYLANKELFGASAVVPKRVAKTAVKRNNLRRLVYRALRATTLPKTGYAVIMVERLPQQNDTIGSALHSCFKHI